VSIIKKMRKQKAVWWQRSAPDHYGKFSFAPPVEIDCRWDDQGVEYRAAQGQTVLSNAVVYPDRILAIGDRLQKGEMESDISEDPLVLITAFEIQRFDQTPNLKATEFLYTAYL